MAGNGRLGIKNKRHIAVEGLARRAIASAEKQQLTPLDVMMARTNGVPLPDGRMPTDSQLQAAIAAAPYIHPRLASTDTTIKSDNVHHVISDKPLSEDEWLASYTAPAAPAVNDASDAADEEPETKADVA